MKVKPIVDAKSAIIEQVCAAAAGGDLPRAIATLRERYPFAPEPFSTRKYGAFQATQVFMRDGFLDRYSGARLVFPPVLRVLSFLLPEQFPYHPAWKTDLTHPAYWEIGATIDHLVPVTRGGDDAESNWFTTSMALNSAKMNWTLEELGWHLYPPGSFTHWDGLMHWFVDFGNRMPALVSKGALRQWYRAAVAALAESRRSQA